MDIEELRKMKEDTHLVNELYRIFNEDARLSRSKSARVEFLTTVRYIEKYLKPGAVILDIGAGAGAYSFVKCLLQKPFSVVSSLLSGSINDGPKMNSTALSSKSFSKTHIGHSQSCLNASVTGIV
jgi:hypothetical protein